MADPQAHPPLRGLVLAGGQSLRMGVDKASLLVGGRTLLARSVGVLQPLVIAVHVGVRADQASDELRRRFAVIVDRPGMAGPAASLAAAWHHDPGCAWLVLACDMPAADHRLLEALVAARDPARGGTAWRGTEGDLPEPLCAIWEPATLARLAAAAGEAGEGPRSSSVSPRALLAAADPLLLNPARPGALHSVNTPADLHRYLEHTHGHKP
ncbi:MAG: NTP transferase domain-containing protein [Chromatiales bacterium]|nr:NTP transferase domain-containing protein [Chromatiales bacterium]